jgi:hypothetical protein
MNGKQVIGRIYRQVDGRTLAALNSLGRELPDNTALYAAPQKLEQLQQDLDDARRQLEANSKTARDLDMAIAMEVAQFYEENRNRLDKPNLDNIITRVLVNSALKGNS